MIASDGGSSITRRKYEGIFKPNIQPRPNRFIWLGSRKKLDAFTFDFRETEWGWFNLHAYRFDEDWSTFIVETPEKNWLKAGIDKMDTEESIALCEKLFADRFDGNALISNATALARLSRVAEIQARPCEKWFHKNIVLIGDAAHTAHFGIGSGTKLAMEDAMALSRESSPITMATSRAHCNYQEEREIEALKLQSAARNRMEWFEQVERYVHLDPEQFTYSLLTGSQRIGHENLKLRDSGYVEKVENWFAARNGVDHAVPPMFTPFKVRGLSLKNRVIVSPMAMYMADDGVPNDFHLVHLGSRAMGGAAMVFTEMTCVSPDARITPACPGMWNDEQRARGSASWITCIHIRTRRSLCSWAIRAAKARRDEDGKESISRSTSDNWPLVSASRAAIHRRRLAVSARSHSRRYGSHPGRLRRGYERGVAAGFDWLEFHCAHGYLMSSFISPLTNRAHDEYGGSLENRCRYPLEVFKAMRAVWPQEKPMSVRISAHDWVPGGITPEDAATSRGSSNARAPI